MRNFNTTASLSLVGLHCFVLPVLLIAYWLTLMSSRQAILILVYTSDITKLSLNCLYCFWLLFFWKSLQVTSVSFVKFRDHQTTVKVAHLVKNTSIHCISANCILPTPFQWPFFQVNPVPECLHSTFYWSYGWREVLVATGAIKTCKAPVKSSPNKPTPNFFTGQMPFLSANQQCRSTEGQLTWNYSSQIPWHVTPTVSDTWLLCPCS